MGVTPEFCDQLLSPANPDYDLWNRVLTPENIKKRQSTTKIGSGDDSEVEETASAVLARAEQRVLCHRYDDALADLNLWPEANREDLKDEFAASIKEYNPEFVTWLAAKSK